MDLDDPDQRPRQHPGTNVFLRLDRLALRVGGKNEMHSLGVGKEAGGTFSMIWLHACAADMTPSGSEPPPAEAGRGPHPETKTVAVTCITANRIIHVQLGRLFIEAASLASSSWTSEEDDGFRLGPLRPEAKFGVSHAGRTRVQPAPVSANVRQRALSTPVDSGRCSWSATGWRRVGTMTGTLAAARVAAEVSAGDPLAAWAVALPPSVTAG